MTLARKWMPSPNYSSRGGARVRLIVLHTAEGSRTIESLGNYFASSSSEVSSHTGIDDTPNTVGEYVTADLKSWTAGGANPVAVQTELCAFAAWTPAEWDAHPVMLENCAQWIAEESARFGIPIRALSAADAQGSGVGVCQHADLGAWGGGHWDAGGGLPYARILERANEIAGGISSPPAPKWKGHNMIASTDTGEGYWTVSHDGAVGAFGDAQYHGGAFSPDVLTGEVVGIAGKGNDGYWLFASDGGILTFGSAAFLGRPDRF